MLYRSICHQVSNQADKLALLAIILLLADVSPTYSVLHFLSLYAILLIVSCY